MEATRLQLLIITHFGTLSSHRSHFLHSCLMSSLNSFLLSLHFCLFWESVILISQFELLRLGFHHFTSLSEYLFLSTTSRIELLSWFEWAGWCTLHLLYRLRLISTWLWLSVSLLLLDGSLIALERCLSWSTFSYSESIGQTGRIETRSLILWGHVWESFHIWSLAVRWTKLTLWVTEHIIVMSVTWFTLFRQSAWVVSTVVWTAKVWWQLWWSFLRASSSRKQVWVSWHSLSRILLVW